MSCRSKNVDMLSHLPDEVLSQILSLMPTKFAVRTSILSKRWRYTWKLITNLDFTDSYYPGYGLDISFFSKFVDRALECYKTSHIKLFRLCSISFQLQKSDVIKWINEAIRLNVCELDIKVWATELPSSVFTCKTLTRLRLHTSDDLNMFSVHYPVMLPGLKTLDLCVTTSSRPSSGIFKFIHGCPMLESLSLSLRMMSYDSEQDFHFNIPTLKRLEIRNCVFANKFVLNLPNLEYLFVGECFCPHFEMEEDFLCLVEATVLFDYIEDFGVNFELLKGLSGVKSLSWTFPYDYHFLYPPLPKFLNLKHLELKRSFKSCWVLFLQVIESSPALEHLSFEEPKESRWFERLSNTSRMFSKLKTMKITECKGRECDMQFLEFVLGNAEVLKTLTIICGSLCMNEEKEMRARLLRFPRASSSCEIHFVGNGLFL